MKTKLREKLTAVRRFAAAVLVSTALWPSSAVFAQTAWTGNANQGWSTNATWSAGVPTASSNISLTPTGAFTLTVDTTTAVGANLDFSSSNNVVLSITNSNNLTLSGNITDTGAGNADINLGNGTQPSAHLTANNIAARQVSVTNTFAANQNRLVANNVTLGGEFRIVGQAGGGFFTFGGNITTPAQFIVNNTNINGSTANYTQTGGTLRASNTSGYGVVIGGEITASGISHGTNVYNLNAGAIEASRIGVNNSNGNNNGTDRWISNGTLNFNEGTVRPLDTVGALNALSMTLTFENGRAFNTYNGSGTKDMSLNTSAPLLIRLASTGNHIFSTASANNTIIVSPSARVVDQTTGGTLTKTGAGSLVFTGGNTANTNTWSGNTTVQGGTVVVDYNRIAGQAATGGTDNLSDAYSSVSRLVLDGGNFTLTGRGSASASSATAVSLAANTFTFTVTSTAGLVIGQAVTNSFLPTGTYIRRIISGTQIELSSMSTSTATQSGQTLNFGAATFDNAQTINNVTLNATTSTVTVNPGSGTSTTLLSFGNVTGTGGLAKAGSGRLQLTGTLDYTGATSVGAGTLEFANASGTNTLTGNVTGSGAIIKSGAGTLILASAVTAGSNFSGSLAINGGTLQIGNTGVNNDQNQRLTSVSSVSVANGATLTLASSGSLPTGSPITLNGTLNTNTTGTTTGFSNVLGAITMNGGNITTANGASGAFQSYIFNGNVTVGGSSASSINAGGTTNNGIHLTAVASGERQFNVADATGNSDADLTIFSRLLNASQSSNASSLLKSGAGTLVLSGNNSFSGNTTVSDGVLSLAAVNALGNTSSVTVASSATLEVLTSNAVNNSANVTLNGGTISRGSGVNETFGGLTLGANATINFGTGATGTLNFGNYTGAGFKLNVTNFLVGNVLTFTTDLTTSINTPSLFGFDNAFTSGWNGSTFTITAIPEPSAVLAGVLALGLFLWRDRKSLFRSFKRPGKIR